MVQIHQNVIQMGSLHACSICGKSFQRKDLRDRHRRRCVLNVSKPRRSRRRSCLPCASSKLGCSLDHPSCSRCIHRGVLCYYANSSIGRSSASRLEETSSSQEPIDPGLDLVAAVANTEKHSTAMTPSWGFGLSQGFDIAHDGVADIVLEENNENIIGLLDSYEASRNAAAWSPSWLDKDLNPANQQPVLPRLSDSNLAPQRALPQASSHLPIHPRSAQSAPYQARSADDLAKIVWSYPQMMIEAECRHPPFVHHLIYRCHQGDVLEPIAKAFCCISADNTSMPSSREFVDKMIRSERDTVVRTFESCSSDIDRLAALHSMIIYQILEFFGGNKEGARQAELHNHFLIKMTRKLIQKYRHRLLTHGIDLEKFVWYDWIFTETLRRTMFLVHVINAVSARTAKQNSYFYEPLDDELVLDMPLPAPEALWKTSSQEGWLSVWPTISAGCKSSCRVFHEHDTSTLEDLDEFTQMIFITSRKSWVESG
ncbi:hypothetical protein B0H63DRAFT_290773 [Podospora didyma]|uniref:Zn(2)-C6 fungal-type domain-containing protein n=1 Tax=Podospora didyma TaxID=330526 RepID=A0AAE0N696_9PEZI|nr:hypothetical protein B0H63DRAFT_290773 [Podospora didyma]